MRVFWMNQYLLVYLDKTINIMILEERLLKEEALKNAKLLTEEEENNIPTVEEICESALSEFNKLCDKIDEEECSLQ